MAVIYDTTMSPGKLELLTVWLPTQPWYLGGGHEPELAKVGGFRLDDPQGEVGDRASGREAMSSGRSGRHIGMPPRPAAAS